MIELLLEDGAIEGLVIEGLGLAHVPEAAMDAVRAVRARGLPVALSTRVHTGRIVPLYANNIVLLELGCIEADNLTAQKARVLLMLAMTRTRDPIQLQTFFHR